MVTVRNVFSVEEKQVDTEGASGVTIRWLIDRNTGAENFAMRMFVLEPGGYTPYHSHDFEHEVFVLEGKGIVRTEDGEFSIEKDSFVFVPPNCYHQFINTGSENLRFLCLIPDHGY